MLVCLFKYNMLIIINIIYYYLASHFFHRIATAFFFAILATSLPVAAEPFLPKADSQILEKLPVNNTNTRREISQVKTSLAQNPSDLRLALISARSFIEVGRRESDPRYAGYAQAALAPWWNRADAPIEVRIMRATLAQSTHRFDAALIELDEILRIDKSNAQAWLTRASILQGQGRYVEALRSCQQLTGIALSLVAKVCSTGVTNISGRAQQSYAELLRGYTQFGKGRSQLRGWVLTQLAEMAARLGMVKSAETHFRAALQGDADDSYLLAAYADFLLDQKRYIEVIKTMQNKTRADGLLLRYAEALKLSNDIQAADQIIMLQQRFKAVALRGDLSHQREQARFALHLDNNPRLALQLAQEN